MKLRALSPLFAALLLPLSLSAQQVNKDPRGIWKEFVALNPSHKELADLLEYSARLQPIYKTFCAEELLRDDPSSSDLITVMRTTPEPFAGYAWEKFKSAATTDELLKALLWVPDRYKQFVYEELSTKELSESEMAQLLQGAPSDVFEKVWAKFVSMNPSKEALLEMHNIFSLRERAAEELLKRDLTPTELTQLITSGNTKEQRETAADRILTSVDATESDLGVIVGGGLDESRTQLAKLRIEAIKMSANTPEKNRLIELMHQY